MYIADAEILAVPIQECGESLIDLKTKRHWFMVRRLKMNIRHSITQKCGKVFIRNFWLLKGIYLRVALSDI